MKKITFHIVLLFLYISCNYNVSDSSKKNNQSSSNYKKIFGTIFCSLVGIAILYKLYLHYKLKKIQNYQLKKIETKNDQEKLIKIPKIVRCADISKDILYTTSNNAGQLDYIVFLFKYIRKHNYGPASMAMDDYFIFYLYFINQWLRVQCIYDDEIANNLKNNNLILPGEEKFLLLDFMSLYHDKDNFIELIKESSELKLMYNHFCSFMDRNDDVLHYSKPGNEGDDNDECYVDDGNYDSIKEEFFNQSKSSLGLFTTDDGKDNIGFVYTVEHTGERMMSYIKSQRCDLNDTNLNSNSYLKERSVMYINYLGVFPAYQNKKYGSAILQFIKQQHPDKILVLFSGSSNNFTINKEQKKYIYNNSIANAQAHFYKKNGFTEVALLEQNKNQSTMSFYYYDPAKEAQGIKK